MSNVTIDEKPLSDPDAASLRTRTVRGALASGAAQGTGFVLRTASMVIMARLLFPKDFGLFGMVTAFTGCLSLFRDFGLSLASVTRASVTEEQRSTLFWVNVAAGFLLAAACVVAAPVLVAFYGEPRLLTITIALGAAFLFSGAGAQHRAILQRSMRFGALATIDTVALAVGVVAGIVMAWLTQSPWALVVMTVAPQAASMIGVWLVTRWVPGRPSRRSGVRSMLWYGGTVTFNTLIVYVAYNADKVLLGRFWGAEALGIYGRAYQLINFPTDVMNSTVGQVAFPALSRLQHDPQRLRTFFLQGYTLSLTLALPLTFGCALFAEDIVRVFLGARWMDAVSSFRLLAPTTLVFALVNPVGVLMMATGYSWRSVKVALMILPTVILGYAVGLPYGPDGVAIGFSTAMLLLAVPIIVWANNGTLITMRDMLRAVLPSVLSVVAGVLAYLVVSPHTRGLQPALLRLVVESAVLFGTYGLVLLFGMKQKPMYMKILGEFKVRGAAA